MRTPASLSKSRLLSYLQCPKRLWLDLHQPELNRNSARSQQAFAIGHQVGDIARRLYDPDEQGALVELERGAVEAAIARSATLLGAAAGPVFEAGFSAGGARAFADVMLPIRQGRKTCWRMVEVKSSSQVKDYHRNDVAIQTFIARNAGIPLASVALAHIDSSWIYPGGEDYRGLLVEEDLTGQAFGREAEVRQWIAAAQRIASQTTEPPMVIGQQCIKPYECGFLEHCRQQAPQAEFPVAWLPRKSRQLKTWVAEQEASEISISMADVPDELLSRRQKLIKDCTLGDLVYFEAERAAAALAEHSLPSYFIDFETIQFTVPIWAGTRPSQKIPFQFSAHRLSRSGKLEQSAFLDLDGGDPSRAFAKALIGACGESGPVFVYNAGFESGRIRELAERFPSLSRSLLAINARIVDLLPIAREYFYHPLQQGSWSIKSVLPVVSELDYGRLPGIRNGGMAMDAYLEALAPETSAQRKEEIRKQLLDYCALDTYAMVRLWQFFSGRSEMSV